MRKISAWMINNFSYAQIYFFICFLFLLSLFPIVFFWIQTHLSEMSSLNRQLEALSKEKTLAHIFTLIQKNRLLTQKQAQTPQDREIALSLKDNEAQVNAYFEQLEKLRFPKETDREQSELFLWDELFPKEIHKKWKALLADSARLNEREKESEQSVILSDIETLFDYLVNRASVNYLNQINEFIFLQSLFLKLPSFQENIAQLLLTTEKILNTPSKELSRDRTQALIDALQSAREYFEKVIETYASTYQATQSHSDALLSLLHTYLDTTKELIQTIQKKVLSSNQLELSSAEFATQAMPLLTKGSEIWQVALTQMTSLFENEKSFVIHRLLVVLCTTLFLTIFAIYLGISLTYTSILRLSELTHATNSFTQGNLSVRVNDTYDDEIGKLAKAFNRMAQRLEEIVRHLYELIEATTALSSGRLQERIPLHSEDPEFNQVALSFNKMAERFQTILTRLQELGMMLKISAAEIAQASKEQETVIAEQESTTQEIAIAAKDISSTARELAKTMNEVNQTAEATSTLALKGKDSLNNMESVMRNMVQASSTIATKLAILNEKAGNITGVITTITKVADQTNLLSLNASIEAEKAGEYGKSFAVIAREIRRLADQSAIATLDIEKMVSDIMAAVSSSVMGVDDFTAEIRKGVEEVKVVSKQLTTIIEQVQAFTARFETVNQGMQMQSTGAEQIDQAIAALSETARHTTEAIHQFHKTVQELNQAANDLSLINPFKV